MDLAISSWSFHRELPNTRGREVGGRLDLEGFLEACRERYGVHGAEIVSSHLLRPGDPAYVRAVRGAVAGERLTLVNLACDEGKVGAAEAAARAENFETLRRWIEIAAALGSRAIRINTAAPDGRSDEEALSAAVADYRELLPAVKERGLVMLLENHGGLSSEPAMVARLLEEVGDAAFRTCPDNGNFGAEVREAGLRAMAPRMALAHLKTLEFDERGAETTFDIPAIVTLYREAGYDGTLSIEFEGPGDPFEGVDRSVALARRAIGG